MAEQREPDPCERLMQFLSSRHIQRQDIANIIDDCHDLAEIMLDNIPHNQELTVGLRKLIEAKDCFVRAKLAV